MKYVYMLFLIVFAACSDDEGLLPSGQREDKATLLNIELSGSLQNPAFSPDGNEIVFTRFINGYNKEPAELYKYNLSTGELTFLVGDGSGNVNLPGSVWIKGKIVFSSSREPHDEIYLISEDAGPGDEIRVTNRPDRVAYEPTFSSDGSWIVFESHLIDVEDNGQIVKYKIEGSNEYIPLTNNGEDCRQPNWSPSGDKILYQKFENNKWDIWIMNPDGSNKTMITSGEANKTDASFSGDGRFIVYSSDFGLKFANIFKISATARPHLRLTEFSRGYDGAPSLSPDGTKLIFESCIGEPDESSGTQLFLLIL